MSPSVIITPEEEASARGVFARRATRTAREQDRQGRDEGDAQGPRADAPARGEASSAWASAASTTGARSTRARSCSSTRACTRPRQVDARLRAVGRDERALRARVHDPTRKTTRRARAARASRAALPATHNVDPMKMLAERRDLPERQRAGPDVQMRWTPLAARAASNGMWARARLPRGSGRARARGDACGARARAAARPAARV